MPGGNCVAANNKSNVKRRKRTVNQKISVRKTGAANQNAETHHPMMDALRAEHQYIAGVMKLFAERLTAIEEGRWTDTHVVYEIMDYMVTWPDRFHHPREDLIYGRVAEIDAQLADSVDSLEREHDKLARSSRQVLNDIADWRDNKISGDVVVASGRAYIESMHAHMYSEEKLVFPQIEAVLTSRDWSELAADDQLQPLSDPVFGPRVDREYRNLARKLRRKVRRGVERGALLEWIGIEAVLESLDVICTAYDSTREVAAGHVLAAWYDSLDFFKQSPASGPIRSVANNTRLTLAWTASVMEITREALEDLSRVNDDHKERLRLLDR